MTVDIFRDNSHIDCRPNGALLKKLTPKTLEVGFRFVSRQARPTEGKWPFRLDAWKYIRRVSKSDMMQALQELGYMTSALREQVSAVMETQNVYHVVIRGNDPEFMPLGEINGQDIPTSYFLEAIELVHEEVDKFLFDEIENPDAIHSAMQNQVFDRMLETFFLNGDTKNEETLHVASRFRAGANLLHTCIKEGYIESLRLLLDKYTVESHGDAARWRVLAEPLRPCGKFKCSAFHRAVFDGRSACLKLLVEWAQRHRHDITKIVNVEERNKVGEASTELTCLELAEKEQNYECYNILAPLFDVPLKSTSMNATSREVRMADMAKPRVQVVLISSSRQEIMHTIELDAADMTWDRLLGIVRQLRSDVDLFPQDRCKTGIRACNLTFAEDACEGVIDELFTAAAGMCSIETLNCTTKSESTCLSIMRTLVSRLSAEKTQELPLRMPSKVSMYCSVVDVLTAEEEEIVNREIAQLLPAYVRECGRWPKFMGASRLADAKQCARLASGKHMEAVAACRAAQETCRVASFLFYNEDLDAADTRGLEDWLRKRALMSFPRGVKQFFNEELLLSSDFTDPSLALDATVILFIKMVISGWFSTAPKDLCADPWSAWAQVLGVSETLAKQELAPALDKSLATVLRMRKAFDPLCKRARMENVACVGDIFKQCIPAPLLARLPSTRDRLERYYKNAMGGKAKRDGPRLSLVSAHPGMSFRPQPGGGLGGHWGLGNITSARVR